MTWKQLFTSSIGKKLVMAFTGLFLVLFLVVHVTINSMIFLNDGGESFNVVAHFMSHNIIVRILEVGLFAGLILHIVQAWFVSQENNSRRGVGYAVSAASTNSTWYSRSMGVLGSLVLIFLVVHLANFWGPARVNLYFGADNTDAFADMKVVFSQWYFVVIYLLGVFALFWHLFHGFQSAFQTLGVRRGRYKSIIVGIGIGYTFIVCILFALMPILMYTQVIQ
ncbi:MAG TPA: succinate dehydrogenase cytochrome b subunit [Dinghuibacter sp.]|uniref:succinate dehydrogenase cytochrome b subunit n=1 Tax=Dinghuibacter sp. TaxID=2024697 RepID=UPI002C7F2AF7|nr:succinate dehydrogenase cytochrome b subunit [Dinghuibacter sp.]HTJ11506.1 succinate dehydrogenase cytochrome b subunit [Dinghuibacter sp.]